MKTVIQRVNHASVTVDGEIKGSIGKGFLILFGAEPMDTDEDCAKIAEKISKLRIFEDENGKTNLSIKDVGGDILSVSQFTLLADCSHGNRPSFIGAAKPDEANRLYEKFNSELRARGIKVETGVFGAHMTVDLENDGPFTIVL
ncbi:MAG: D-tyrosyl-tRNA(Tyr) deacylase [Oscillospiraceae bacterium]|nr:D-tyrosyl-tRNA(Tyr) deacylase [Oscillospiraceae bacterium]